MNVDFEESEPMERVPLIHWHPRYSDGNPVIDKQHHALVDIINELYFAFPQGERDIDLEPIYKKLAQYTIMHFTYEEKWLRDSSYPDLEDHLKLHQEMKEKESQFNKSSQYSDKITTRELFDYLKKWWLSHILADDVAYSEYSEFKKKNNRKKIKVYLKVYLSPSNQRKTATQQ